jgi:glycosyltransferase involved in cell wall biosynthesis
MIYVCIPARDEGETLGLLLWKIRKVFTEFRREYQLLVLNDGSTDDSAERLESYTGVLPLTVMTHDSRRGYAASAEILLRLALERTDRPRRDAAVLMHADFTHNPDHLPDLIRRLESGADLAVAQGQVEGPVARGYRLLRRLAPRLLGRGGRVPGVRDPVSGFFAVRLSCLRLALRQGNSLATLDGWAASAELLGRLAPHARRLDTVPVVERHDLRQRSSRVSPWAEARALLAARRALRPLGAGAAK